MKVKTAFALLVATMAIDSRFDVVASSLLSSSSSILDGSDPQATRKTRRMLKSKHQQTCQKETAGLEDTITELKEEIKTLQLLLNDGGGYGEVVADDACSFSVFPSMTCNDSTGDIITARGSSLDDCCTGCTQVPGCTAFTYDKYNSKGEEEGTCIYKSSCNSKVPSSNADSGVLPPGPRGPDLCPNGHIDMDETSIWRHEVLTGRDQHSCYGSYNPDGFSQCQGDPTSISLDMSKLSRSQKHNCFAYNTMQYKNFKTSEIRGLSFDAQWENCDDVWVAPIWLCPSDWKGPQGMSGEIDFIETCRTNDNYGIKTAIQCDDHNPKDAKCYEPNWGNGQSSNGVFHFIGQIDHNSGDWTMHKCDNLNETNVNNCQLISRYPKYLSKNTGSKENQDFFFVSDLWGGTSPPAEWDSNDDGFKYCGNDDKPDTTCKYTVANIVVLYK